MSTYKSLKQIAKRYLPHSKEYYFSYLFRRASSGELTSVLENLGLRPGSVVFVHAAFKRLGYHAGGARGFIELLKQTVGERGTIAMPAFPFSGSMQDHVASDPQFDLLRTPSKSGYLTEALRLYPGSVRSLHPTHSVCALGENARDLVANHENCQGPCGPGSPFDRLADLDAVILRIGTRALTLCHHVQELVEYPNLFLEQPANLHCTDSSGTERNVQTWVYRKQIPVLLFLGHDTPTQHLNTRIGDFPLLYSGQREERLRQDPRRQEVLRQLLEIRRSFEESGKLRRADVNGCRFELFRVRDYLELAVPEVQRLLAEHGPRYELSALRRLLDAGGYPGK